MQSHTHNFAFYANYNFGTDSVFVEKSENEGAPFPPAPGNFLELAGPPLLLLNGGNFLLL